MTTFQTKFFVAALGAALLALAVAGIMFATTTRRQLNERIENTLVAEARLAADLLSRAAPLSTSTVPELEEEANRIMLDVHKKGSGTAGVFTLEMAEMKVMQVNQFARVSQHPLKSTLEPE